jgi:cellulose biosynthesis protein BcsQ
MKNISTNRAYTFLITNGRGGVGKTNIAYALAETSARLGYKTALVDCDRSETLKRKLTRRRAWHANEERGVTDIPFTFLQCWFEDEIKGKKRKCREKLYSTTAGFEVAVVDISGELSRVQANIAPITDFIIMPMAPEMALVEFTMDSYVSLYSAIQDEEALDGKEHPIITAVKSRWEKNTKTARACQSYIDQEVKEYEYDVLKTTLNSYVTYNKAGHFGVSVLDTTEVGDSSDRKAAEQPVHEMKKLCKEVLVRAGLATPKMKRANDNPTVPIEGLVSPDCLAQ